MTTNEVAAPSPVPGGEMLGAPPPPPPPPPPARQPADFAASAAMANDILALGGDDLQPPDTPRRTEALKPRAVPELDEDLAMALSFNGSPLASDFFTSARSKPKKHRWRLTR